MVLATDRKTHHERSSLSRNTKTPSTWDITLTFFGGAALLSTFANLTNKMIASSLLCAWTVLFLCPWTVWCLDGRSFLILDWVKKTRNTVLVNFTLRTIWKLRGVKWSMKMYLLIPLWPALKEFLLLFLNATGYLILIRENESTNWEEKRKCGDYKTVKQQYVDHLVRQYISSHNIHLVTW